MRQTDEYVEDYIERMLVIHHRASFPTSLDNLNTLSKCPSSHPVLHRRLKLNPNISAEKCKKKLNSPGPVDFPPGSSVKIMFKTCRNFIKSAVILAKIQIAREACHHLTLTESFQAFHLQESLGLLLCPNS